MTTAIEKKPSITKFYLYGEAPREVDHNFLHIEKIADRSAPVDGHIRPHMHADLNHFFLITHGSGRIVHDDRQTEFAGACVVFMPAGVVHGFDFSDDIAGLVLTVATAYLQDLTEGRDEIAGLGDHLVVWPIAERHGLNGLRQWVLRLARELVWQARARRMAIEANILGFLADVQRLPQGGESLDSGPASPQRLLARFRREIERHFRSGRPLSRYLRDLGASEAQLRYACQSLGDKPPRQMIIDRRLIEAKRLLLYTGMTVSECAIASGFDDPGYFSRLFTRHTGRPPSTFRLNSPL